MLKARPIPAMVIKLGTSTEATAVFMRGTTWNGLTEYICIAPATLAGGKMITCDKGRGHLFAEMFATITGAEESPFDVVLADPKIERAIRDAEAHFAAKDQAKDAAEQAQKAPETTQN